MISGNHHCLTLVDLVEHRGEKQPGQTVYTFINNPDGEASLTYFELEQRARAVGAILQDAAAPGARILLLFPPGLDYIAAFLGCLYAGMIAVPVYPPRLNNRPMPRFQAIVEDALATVALTDSSILEKLQKRLEHAPFLSSLHWIATDTLSLADGAAWKMPAITGDTVAFLQYTSGSTAAPKGVVLTHANLLANLKLIYESFAITKESHGVIWLPPYHDMGLIGGILQPLYGGVSATLMAPVAFLQRPLTWLETISQQPGPVVSGGPNFAYDLCVDKIDAAAIPTLDLSRWQVAFNGAEPIRAVTMERFAAAFAPAGFQYKAFYPCYGLAEATLIVAGGRAEDPPKLHTIDPNALRQHQIIPSSKEKGQSLVSSGRTLSGQEILIVDPETLNPAAPQTIGEIWVKGDSVAQGYWQQPEKTQATFQARLTGSEAGPYLRTGDLGFLHEDELYVTGRIKDLIIIRGRNYYPQDIELTVEQSHEAVQPSCSAAITITVQDTEQLVILQELKRQYVRSEGKETIINAIREAVFQDFELPVYAVLLLKPGTIPKTSSGKIQRHLCQTRFLENDFDEIASSILSKTEQGVPSVAAAEASFIRKALQTTSDKAVRYALLILYLQEQVARLLSLTTSEITPDRPLSHLGIDSLTAVEFNHLLEIELGVQLPLTYFFEGISLSELATRILEADIVSRDEPGIAAAAPTSSPITAPASHGQQALWFLQQLNPESAAYHIANAVRIETPLDTNILQYALQQLVARHPSLRTTFAMVDERLVQQITPTASLNFLMVDARHWSQTYLDEQLAQEAHHPFDLQQDALLRVRLYQLADGVHILLLVMHHIITDFWSLTVLVQEVAEIYSAENKGQKAVLLPLTTQYYDYAQEEVAFLENTQGQERWHYWQKQLGGKLPILDLATDFHRPAIQTFQGATQSRQWGQALVAQLNQFSRQQGVTLYMTLAAAFQVLLHRYSGQTDILIGSPSANRNQAELARVVGYFVNPLVLRANLEGDPTFAIFLQQVRGTVLEAFAHQDYPFALLAERLQPQRDPSRSPIFQAMFMFQNAPYRGRTADLTPFALSEPGHPIIIGDLRIEPVPLQTKTSQFDITLMVAETPQGLRAALQYNSDLFRPETIERMLNHYYVLLNDIVRNAWQPVSRLALLDEADQQRILRTWNQSALPLPEIQCLQQQFETQAARTPHADAIIFEDQVLSYAELNQRANQLAHHLRKLGVGPEVLVGVCMRRSPEMIVALLGVLKAGGAYVPLDPTYPAERIAFILQDAAAPVLLSQHHLQDRLTTYRSRTLYLDSDWPALAQEPITNPVRQTTPQNLAYVIYTSGSTGRPKGVMVQHDSVHNFFAAMDEKIGCTSDDTILAVTSIAFDISVLELFWTLVRGVRVVLLAEEAIHDTAAPVLPPSTASTRPLEFSLFYFAADESQAGQDKYELLLEGAKFADQHGFRAVWTPERHFHAFGGLYPNPSVIGAALATITQKVRIRAGSVVLPLHHPVRIAEEWSVVDNLSRGRVDIAFASGWHVNDFIFYPQNYQNRREVMAEGINTVRRLWRGEAITVTGGAGNTLHVNILPRPVQPELPIWITAAGNPETFIEAGKMGANILTHLLGQSFEELAEKIKLYRQTRAAHGYLAHTGHVSLMLHTFVSDDAAAIRDIVRLPFMNYLRTSVGLIAGLVRSLNLPFDIDNMSEADMATLLSFAFDRYFDTSALFGTPESALAIIEQIKAIDVDEVACLIDFGIAPDTVLNNLPHLAHLKENANRIGQTARYSLVAQAQRYHPTLMQCTPSLMNLLLLNPATATALQSLHVLMLGGEALPATLAQQVKSQLPARLVNMYGPTETTIWSATHEIKEATTTIPIGGPIANTQIYILDRHMQPVPAGVSGELYLGGHGVTRGYQQRVRLTATRFVPDPFSQQPGQRLYRTGDLARHRPDGTIEFLGRADFQVKVRGFRVEPGEIERVLTGSDTVRDAVVIAREDTPGDVRLVAYVVPHPNLNGADGSQEWRTFLKAQLPDYMIPSLFVKLDRLPLTPNGKINRQALPAPSGKRESTHFVAPRSQIEQKIATIWQQALKVDKVGVDDNFFDLGGHSLLMAHVHNQLCQTFDRQIPLVKMLEHSTVRAMAKFLSEEQNEQAIVVQGQERAQKQRAARRQMRRVGP